MFIAHQRPRRNSNPLCFGMYSALLALSLSWGEPVSAQAAADNMVTAISTSGAADSMEISISTARRPDASVFALSSPSRIVVDIDQALPGKITAPVTVNKGPVLDISARELKEDGGTITRITIMLSAVVDFTPEISDSGVVVRLKPKSAGGANIDPEMDDIAARLEKMGTENSPPVKNTETVEEVVGSPTPAASPSTAPSAPKTTTTAVASRGGVAGPVELTGLDFLPYEQRSRIRIAGTGPLSYSLSPAGKDMQVVVDLPEASVPRSLQRPLDTSAFPSAVKMVSAYPLKDGRNGTRVAIKLRENVKPTVDEKGEQLFIDFAVPKSISTKLPSNPEGQGSMMVAQKSQAASSDESAPAPRPMNRNGQMLGAGSQQSEFGSLDGVMIGEQGSSSGVYNGRRISIDVREADLHNVFRMISNVSKLNIVAGDNVSGKVTVRLQNVPWDQALAVVLQSKGLGAVRFGNIVRIAPLETLKTEQEARLQARKAATDLEQLQTLVLPLNFAIASDIKSQVEGALTSRGKLTLDSRTNAIIIEDTATGVAKARELAQSLDTQTPQVLIEARIVEVSSTFLKEFGIQWGGDVNASAATGAVTGLYFPNGVQLSGGTGIDGSVLQAGSGKPNWVVDLPTASSAGSLALNLGSISDIINVDARLTAIESMGRGRVISSPKVVTVDNKEAVISQGTRIPYETVSAAGTAVQFIEATLRLQVTPHITQDNRVFLKVRVTNNRPDFGNQVNGNPAIEVKEASTEVMVKDGDTTVLGGVYTINESESVTGLPGLQHIPVLGWLFKGKTERSERKELLVFITPHVVSKKVATR